jgi:protein phosphatase 2C family protein 2/3
MSSNLNPGSVSSIQTKKGFISLVSGYVSEKGDHRKQNEDVILIVTDFLSQYPKECRELGIKHNPFATFAIFDGHGGPRAAMFAQQHLPRILLTRFRETMKCSDLGLGSAGSSSNLSSIGLGVDLNKILYQSILDIERLFLRTGWEDGTTALVALISNDGRFVVANVGDCEGLLIYQPLRLADRYFRPLVRKEPLYPFAPHNLNRNPSEICRITENKGEIIDHRLCLRTPDGQIQGLLAVSRAIGDRAFKGKTPISAFPDLQERKLTGYEESIIMACDGLWDVLTAEDVFIAVEKCKERGCSPVETAQLLVNLAYQNGSTDNVTVIVIFFNQDF